MKQLLVAVLAGLMVSGCYIQQQPIGPPPADAAPPPPPPSGYPPPPPPANGYGYGPSEYQRGLEDGRAAGLRTPVVGYAALGFVLGLVVAPVCLVLIAAGGGGGSGDCGSGSCYTGDDNVPVPMGPEGPVAGSGDYRAGWQKGWSEAVRPRRQSAETVGFITGVAVALAAVVIYLSVAANRDNLQNHSGAATAAAPPGAPAPAGGIGIRF